MGAFALLGLVLALGLHMAGRTRRRTGGGPMLHAPIHIFERDRDLIVANLVLALGQIRAPPRPDLQHEENIHVG